MQALRAREFTYAQIAAKLGISKSYARDLLYDPDGSKSKRRKDRYRGTCRVCGASTTGSNGRQKAPTLCMKCAPAAIHLIWSTSKIIAAIHEWHYIYGRTPIATDWNRKVEGSPGQYVKGSRKSKRRWPPINTVQKQFGSWANAIEAAGFPRPIVGHYRDESQRGAILTKWSDERIIEWIREHAVGGKPPSTTIKAGKPIRPAIRAFGSWNNAVVAAGFKPNRIVRSTR